MSLRRPPISVVLRLLAGLLLLSQGGCMSALTTAAMREALRETVDSLAAATATDVPDSGRDADVSASLATDEAGDEPGPVISEPKAPSLDEAVDLAVARLKSVGALDAPTQATLLSILEKTNPEDWPAAIDAFAASLEAYRPPPRAPAPATAHPLPVASTEPEPNAPLVFPASSPPSHDIPAEPAATAVVFEPPAEPQVESPLIFPAPSSPEPARLELIEAARPVGPEPEVAAEAAPVFAPRAALEPLDAEEPIALAEPPAAIEPPATIEPPLPAAPPRAIEQPETAPLAPPTLAVRNACFVSRVRAWGVVDRFPESVFRPGQDVIVYFELEAPTTRHSPAGHTTSIDTLFRLFAPDGRQVGQWDFEPIDETCHAPRRDYFARYFVRIPDTAPPGPYRLELMVTDLVAGISSQAHLDLEVRQ